MSFFRNVFFLASSFFTPHPNGNGGRLYSADQKNALQGPKSGL